MCVQGEIVETAVGETISVVWWMLLIKLHSIKVRTSHFAFFILAIRLAFASVEMLL